MGLKPFVYDPPTSPWLRVLHRDAHILVVDKPSGLLTVAGGTPDLADCLADRVLAQDAEARLLHRLDKDTSGVVLFARSKSAQRHLGLQFERRQVRKRYIARAWGRVPGTTGEIDLPIATDPERRPAQQVDVARGRAAVTGWEVIFREAVHTRLRLSPQTGRSHQLRVHLLALGHPVLGDTIYGHAAAEMAAARLQLHAATLRFRHPDGGAWVEFSAPCPF